MVVLVLVRELKAVETAKDAGILHRASRSQTIDLAILTGKGSPAAVMILFAFWYVGPT